MRLLLSILLTSLLCACDLNVGGSQNGDSDDDTTIISNETGGEGVSAGDNPMCVGVNGVDGPGGFLWKPESDSDGKLAILFPKEYTALFLQVLVFKDDGKADTGVFSGFSNDNRQTYRFPQSGGHYDGRVFVDDINQTCEWFVGDPDSIQD